MYPPQEDDQNPLAQVNNAFTATGNPADSDQSFGGQGTFKSAALAQSGAAATAEDNAMQYLRQAMNKSQEISPSQGFAAALLAAIPTLGGALISRANPTPKLPAGVYYKNPNDLLEATQGTGDAAAAQGAALGGKLASGYVSSVAPDNTALYEKMSALQATRAQQLQGSSDSLAQAGLTQAAEDNRNPLVNPAAGQAQIALDKQRNAIQVGGQEATMQYGYDHNPDNAPDNTPLDPSVAAKAATQLGIDPSSLKTQDDLNTALDNAKQMADINKTSRGSGGDPKLAIQLASHASQAAQAEKIANVAQTSAQSTQAILAKDPAQRTNADDTAIIEAGARILNPQGTIKEGPLQLILDSVPPESKTAGVLKNWITNGQGGRLPDDAIQQIGQMILDRNKTYQDAYQGSVAPYVAIAKANSIPLDQVLSTYAGTDTNNGNTQIPNSIPQRTNYSNSSDYLKALTDYNNSHSRG